MNLLTKIISLHFLLLSNVKENQAFLLSFEAPLRTEENNKEIIFFKLAIFHHYRTVVMNVSSVQINNDFVLRSIFLQISISDCVL